MSGTSLFNTEEVSRKWFPSLNTITVRIAREATLTADLSALRSRRLHHIEVDLGNLNCLLKVDRDEAAWLVEALTTAIGETAEFADGSIYFDEEDAL